MDLRTSSQTPFAKDTVYRFLNDTKINWSRFLLILSSRVIEKIRPLTSDSRRNVIIFDDSTYERSCSKKAELLAKIYDHSTSAYKYGYRLLTIMWSDGNTSIPLDSRLISTENAKNRINEAKSFDKRSNAHKIRKEVQSKANSVVLEMLKRVKKYSIGANYVLFDTWFCFPTSLINIKKLGFNVIGMIKRLLSSILSTTIKLCL